jgi:multiple sugar transport system substrate-binding protein
MTDKLLTVLKIGVVVLIVIAIGMGGWFVYARFFRGGGDDGNGTDQDTIQLTWWVLWEEEENLQVLADAYEAQNPNVDIVIESQEVESQYRQKLLEFIGDDIAGNGPDIARIHNTWLSLFEDYLSSLPSSVMDESTYSSTFYDTALLDFKGKDGNIYAIPLMFDSIGVYYNKTLLESAGYTVPEENWDDFLSQAQALTVYDEEGNIQVAGAGIGTANNVDFAFDIASLLMLQEGATLVNSSGKTTFSTDSEMRAAKALKFYTDFSVRHSVWDRTLPRDITMFAEGRLAMMFAPSWRVFDIEAALETAGATLDYDIAPVPQQPTISGDEVTWANYWAEAVSAESAHPDVAWDFLKFISESEQLRTLYEKCSQSRAFGEIYSRKELADEIISDKYVGAYIKMADTSKSWRMVDYDKVSDEFEDLIEDIVISGGMSKEAIHSKLEDTAIVVDQILATGN